VEAEDSFQEFLLDHLKGITVILTPDSRTVECGGLGHDVKKCFDGGENQLFCVFQYPEDLALGGGSIRFALEELSAKRPLD